VKLLAIESSRLTKLFQVTRPKGQPYLPQAAASLVERYSFSGVPQSINELLADRVEFTHGHFEESAIERLEIYRDGVVISSQSDTKLLDAFLADLMQWFQEELGFTLVQNRRIDQMFESNLIVSASNSILKSIVRLEKVAGSIGKMVLSNCGLQLDFVPMGFTISDDPSRNPDLKPVVFRLERRLASEFQFNQFISVAPLRTSQHIELLGDIERMFAD
jgi:hypothetical protein